jgi:class I fructose-bisphosphate aldolase
LKAGAMGLSIGRNAFQHKDPEKIVGVLCKMVHNGASVKDAIKLLKK